MTGQMCAAHYRRAGSNLVHDLHKSIEDPEALRDPSHALNINQPRLTDEDTPGILKILRRTVEDLECNDLLGTGDHHPVTTQRHDPCGPDLLALLVRDGELQVDMEC